MLSKIMLICSLLVSSIAVRAVDKMEYNRTMAKHYFEAGDEDKAEKFADDGLVDAPNDAELLQIKKTYAKQRHSEEAKLIAAQKKSAVRVQAASRAAAAKENAAQSKEQGEMYCRCEGYEAIVQAQIDEELEVGKASGGYVNKVKLHSLGSQLVLVRKYKKAVQSKSTISSCSERTFKRDELTECLYKAAWNK